MIEPGCVEMGKQTVKIIKLTAILPSGKMKIR